MKKTLSLCLVLIILFLFTNAKQQRAFSLTTAQDAVFFESKFDRSWSGSIEVSTRWGKRHFPVILNLNCLGNSGIGFGRISTGFDISPGGMHLFRLKNIVCKGNKLNLESAISNEISLKHNFLLKFKKKAGKLSGKYTLTPSDGQKIRGKATLYPQSKAKFLQKVWQGSLMFGESIAYVYIQLSQKEQIGSAADPDATEVGGFGFIGDAYGTISHGTYNGKKFMGDLILRSQTVRVKLKKIGLKLTGRFNGATFSKRITLTPVGNEDGKPLAIESVEPPELFPGTSILSSVQGRNFERGIMLHVDNPKINVKAVDSVEPEQFHVLFSPSSTMSKGSKASVRIVSLSGDSADLSEFIELREPESRPKVSYLLEIQPQFSDSCAVSGCHAGESPKAGLDLSSGGSYERIVRKTSSQMITLNLINPNDPDGSYLIRKMLGQGITGARMPQGRYPLGLEIVALFEIWIWAGALYN